MKKIVQRSCIGCNTKKDKRDLIRIVKPKEGEVVIDKTGKLPGRGAYICGDKDCFMKMAMSKKIDKVLETKVPDEIYKELRGVILEQGK